MTSPEESTDNRSQDRVTLNSTTLSALGVFIKDFVTGETIPSAFWTRLGHTVSEMRGTNWLDYVHPEDREKAGGLQEATIFHHSSHIRESFRVRDAQGVYRWVLSSGVVEDWLPDGTPRRYIGLDVDVTELHELQESLQAAQEVAEVRALEAETLRTAGAVIASSLDTADAARRVLQQLEALIRIDVALIFEKKERSIAPILVRDPPTETEATAIDFFAGEFGQSTLNEVMRSKTLDVFREPAGPSRFWMVVPLVVAAGSIGILALSRSDGNEFAGHELRFAMSIGDFLAIAMKNARLYKRMATIASTDHLTEVLTRFAFFERAESLFSTLRDDAAAVACIIIDIDHFKRINDTHGHMAGDQVLRIAAHTMKANMRDDDLLCRFGGEEFCALLPRTGIDEARDVAERVCTAIGSLHITEIDGAVTVSIGVAGVSSSATSFGDSSLDGLIHRADTALYAAKERGRNRVAIADQ